MKSYHMTFIPFVINQERRGERVEEISSHIEEDRFLFIGSYIKNEISNVLSKINMIHLPYLKKMTGIRITKNIVDNNEFGYEKIATGAGA